MYLVVEDEDFPGANLGSVPVDQALHESVNCCSALDLDSVLDWVQAGD